MITSNIGENYILLFILSRSNFINKNKLYSCYIDTVVIYLNISKYILNISKTIYLIIKIYLRLYT